MKIKNIRVGVAEFLIGGIILSHHLQYLLVAMHYKISVKDTMRFRIVAQDSV